MKPQRLAMIGVGAMGRPMAINLLKAGYALTVHDHSADRAVTLVEHGGRVAPSAAAAAQDAAVVLILVRTGEQALEAVLTGSDSALPALRPGSIVILMSTVPPAVARRLGEACATAGVHLLDAPISGGVGGAETGTLAIMVGGDAAAFESARPILETLGRADRIWRVGDRPGDGQSVKMLNQLLVGVHLAATAEVLALARQAGVDPGLAHAIIGQSAGRSFVFDERLPRMAEGNFNDVRSRLDILAKDLGIVLDTAASFGLPLHVAAAARQVFLAGVNQGWAAEDDTGLARVYQSPQRST